MASMANGPRRRTATPMRVAIFLIVEYHVGGSREPTPARTVCLPLGAKPVKLDPKLVATVHLQGELATLFEGEPGLRIADKIDRRIGDRAAASLRAGQWK